MNGVLFVGDGRRDAEVLPQLVGTLTQRQFPATFAAWSELRLHKGQLGRGYERKLRLAIRQARDAQAVALVAVADGDKSPSERLNQLRAGRSADREKAVALPTAVGVAVPHLEAWLLDDAVAVRSALKLPPATPIAAVSRIASPKEELHRIWCETQPRDKQTDATRLAALRDIAARLSLARCSHAEANGLAAFNDELEGELVPALDSAR